MLFLLKINTFIKGVFSSEFVFLSCGDFDGNQMRREALHKKI
jgi:hypothetical protein